MIADYNIHPLDPDKRDDSPKNTIVPGGFEDAAFTRSRADDNATDIAGT